MYIYLLTYLLIECTFPPLLFLHRRPFSSNLVHGGMLLNTMHGDGESKEPILVVALSQTCCELVVSTVHYSILWSQTSSETSLRPG